jgi:hypothetical protein
MMEPLSIKIITLKKMVLRYYSNFFLNYLFIGTSRKQHG